MRTLAVSRDRPSRRMNRTRALSTRESSPAVTLQILATEHWSLLSTRTLTWNESFSRATMFLSTVSGSVIAVAFVAQASSFSRESVWFALAVLTVALSVGIATFVRLIDVNREDVLWVRGMNRLRNAYVELAPQLAQFFVASREDDDAGVLQTLGASSDTRPLYHHLVVTTPAMVAVIDAAIVGALSACVALLAELSAAWTIALSVSAFGATTTVLFRYQLRTSGLGAHRASSPSDTVPIGR